MKFIQISMVFIIDPKNKETAWDESGKTHVEWLKKLSINA